MDGKADLFTEVRGGDMDDEGEVDPDAVPDVQPEEVEGDDDRLDRIGRVSWS